MSAERIPERDLRRYGARLLARIRRALALAPRCLRCRPATPLRALDAADEVAFFECPLCGRHYARGADGALTDRWLSPLSIALYGVARYSMGQQAVEYALHELRRLPSRKLVAVLDDILEELTTRRQRIASMLPFPGRPSENRLRFFLRVVADGIERELERRTLRRTPPA